MVSAGIYTNGSITNIYIILDSIQQKHLMAASNGSRNGLISLSDSLVTLHLEGQLINHHLKHINPDILGKLRLQNDSRRGKTKERFCDNMEMVALEQKF